MVTHVVTLANSIVGVSVLAMPFCFKFCGVFLATCMLMSSAVMTRIVCYFLLKAGVMTKRRSYEMLAYHAFGQGGKFMVEVTIIGFLMGTLIAFLVVIGDLGPQIVAEIFSIENNDSLRTVVMTGLALFVALPLGLLRDIDSLGSVSTISFLFYLFLVLKILNEGIGSLGTERMESLNYWRLSGALQCIPIFAMALSCQTQIFSIYDSLPDPSVQKMNDVVKKAVYLCTSFYFCVGFFGYVAFSNEGITGNILMSFGSTWTTQLIKACFVLSIAFSVPLCIFPCRSSLHSLFFKGVHTHQSLHDMSTNYIPDGKLRLLTVLIVATTLIIAILIPNIELVLGLVGSTAGSVICLIFPSAMFIRVTPKKTTERLLAQAILVTGICVMFLTTYATLYAVEQAKANPPKMMDKDTIMLDKEVILGPIKTDGGINAPLLLLPNDENIVKFEHKEPLLKDSILPKDPKKEPVQKILKPVLTEQKEKPSPAPKLLPLEDVKKEDPPPLAKKVEEPIDSKREADKYKQEVPVALEPKPAAVPAPDPVVERKVDIPAPQPETKEVPKRQEDLEEKTKDFLKKLEEHQAEQKDLIQKQKEILAQLEEHHKEDMKAHQSNGEGHIEKQKEILSNLRKTTAGELNNAVVMDALKDGLKTAINDKAAKKKEPSPPIVEMKVVDPVPVPKVPEVPLVVPHLVESQEVNGEKSEVKVKSPPENGEQAEKDGNAERHRVPEPPKSPKDEKENENHEMK